MRAIKTPQAHLFLILIILCLLAISACVNSSKSKRQWLDSGDRFYNQSDYDKAIVCYNEAIVKDSCYESALIGKGLALSKLKKFDQAARTYEQAVTCHPTSEIALFNLGVVYSKLFRHQEALSCFESVLALDSTVHIAMAEMALQHTFLGHYDSSIVLYERAVKFFPSDSRVINNRGEALLAAGRTTDAERDCLRAIEIDSSYCEAYHSLAKVYNKQGDSTLERRSLRQYLHCPGEKNQNRLDSIRSILSH